MVSHTHTHTYVSHMPSPSQRFLLPFAKNQKLKLTFTTNEKNKFNGIVGQPPWEY